MKNPFKFGTIVEDTFFTDRQKEQQYIQHLLDSENHLILISPRRFGKTSLIVKVAKQSDRPWLMLNLQKVVSISDLASQILKEIFKLYPWERMKHLMNHFRFVPTISANPVTNGVDVSFQPMTDTSVLLEDTMSLMEKVSSPDSQLIVILDEFQEIMQIGKGLDKQLRAIMQTQKNLNYIILGSQESMMEEIFERKKSPFYHFGTLMHLSKIPREDFHSYLQDRLDSVLPQQSSAVANDILDITNCHPYYTQQLASQVWELATYEGLNENIAEVAVSRLTDIHDLDFERLWISFNRMDKRIFQLLCKKQNPLQSKQLPTSTAYSSIKRLMKAGYVIKTDSYEVEDPFFKRWIATRQL